MEKSGQVSPVTSVLKQLLRPAPFSLIEEVEALFNRLDQADSLPLKLTWAKDLAEWLRLKSAIPLPLDASVSGRSAAARLWLFYRLLHELPDHQAKVSALFRDVLESTSALHLLSETGLPAHQRFSVELINRLSDQLLPRPLEEHELSELVQRMFKVPQDIAWIDELPPDLLLGFARKILPESRSSSWKRFRLDLLEAILVLSGRTGALGLHRDFRDRCNWTSIQESPFYLLTRTADAFVRSLADETDAEVHQDKCLKAINGCRDTLKDVTAHLEESGVSVDLVFRIELAQKQLRRLETLLHLASLAKSSENGRDAIEFFVALVRDSVDDRSIRSLLRRNVHQLSRKIVKSAGHTGEHYITSTRSEYAGMWRSSIQGGGLMSIATVLKYSLTPFTYPLFVEGLLVSVNYAASFLAIQFTGSTLATKQTSATAAALARAIGESGDQMGLRPLAQMTARIIRSQLAAVIGNVFAVSLGAAFLNWLILTVSGRHFMTQAQGAYVFKSLHPWESGTAFYAALTGVLLWLSSVAGGWFDNWIIFRKLPDAIAKNRKLNRILGPDRCRTLSEFLLGNASGIAGNSSLGFMLGMLPVFGRFLGLPLDIRHVTLAAGAVTFAACGTTQDALMEGPFLWALAGLLLVGVLNVGVSLAMALTVALRASGVTGHEFRSLVGALKEEWKRNPRNYFLPPAE